MEREDLLPQLFMSLRCTYPCLCCTILPQASNVRSRLVVSNVPLIVTLLDPAGYVVFQVRAFGVCEGLCKVGVGSKSVQAQGLECGWPISHFLVHYLMQSLCMLTSQNDLSICYWGDLVPPAARSLPHSPRPLAPPPPRGEVPFHTSGPTAAARCAARAGGTSAQEHDQRPDVEKGDVLLKYGS